MSMDPQYALVRNSDMVQTLAEYAPRLTAVLPPHLTQERMARVVMTQLAVTPKLGECTLQSFMNAVMGSAQLGLEPDGIMGQAYLVPFKKTCTLIVGYKGYITLARNSGEVRSLEAHEVRENDMFEFEYGLTPRCRHIPARGDRGDVTYFYAVAQFRPDGAQFEVMSREEIEDVRNESAGYKYAESTGKEDSPWHTDPVAMGRKTPIRRLAKYLPMNVQRAAALSDAYDRGIALTATGDQFVLDPSVEPRPDPAAPADSSDPTDPSEPATATLKPKSKSGPENGKDEVLDAAQFAEMQAVIKERGLQFPKLNERHGWGIVGGFGKIPRDRYEEILDVLKVEKAAGESTEEAIPVELISDDDLVEVKELLKEHDKIFAKVNRDHNLGISGGPSKIPAHRFEEVCIAITAATSES